MMVDFNKPTKFKHNPSLGVQCFMSIQSPEQLPYQTFVQLLKKRIPYDPELYEVYLITFFEECSPKLIKAFMQENAVTRNEVMDMFKLLPAQLGETYKFREAVANGEF